MKNTVVIGSINRDYTFLLDHLPGVGETILSSKVYDSTGGKGANQAIALAKMETDVTMIGAVGNDESGTGAVETLAKNGISVCHVLRKEVPTGSAFVCVDKAGYNMIVVNPGANKEINCQDIDRVKTEIANADFCLMQLEIDLETVLYAAKLCKEHDVKVVLNPAPAMKLPSDLLSMVDILIPNETELEILTGREVCLHNVIEVGRILINQGVKALIVTMGENGAYYMDAKQEFLIPAHKTTAIDTTAAGDSFIGALLSALSRDKTMKEAMEFASLVASVTVSRPGAAESIPSWSEINHL